MNYVKVYLLILLIALAKAGVSQTERQKIDSLQLELLQNLTEEDRVATLIILGKAYQTINFDSATIYATAALNTAVDANDSTVMRVQNLLGTIYLHNGQYNKAIVHFMEGLMVAETRNNHRFQITFLVNIGALYDRQKSYKKAEQYYLRSIDFINDETNRETPIKKAAYLGVIYNNLANVYGDGDRRDTTLMITYYEKALVQSAVSNDRNNRSIVLNNLGNTQLQLKEYEKAYKNITASLALKQEFNDTKGLAQCYRNLGYYFSETKEPDSATYYFKKSIEAAQEVGSLEEVADSREGLAEVYESTGNIREALDEFKSFKVLSDSLYNDKKLSEISRIESSYAFEREQSILRAEQKKRELQTYIVLSLLIGVIVIFILLFFIQRNRMKSTKLKNKHLTLQRRSLELEKENLNKDLEHKNREMTSKVLYLYKKNELVDNVIKQLKDMHGNLKSENRPIVKRVIKNLGEALNEDSWNEFELRFNEIHQEFYKTLEQDYPELTPNERKLCAFLKLNSTSKEIASLTGQSLRSIDVARTRLRKKLNLTNTETNLIDFLVSI